MKQRKVLTVSCLSTPTEEGGKEEKKIFPHLRMKEKSIWCWKMSSFSSSMLNALLLYSVAKFTSLHPETWYYSAEFLCRKGSRLRLNAELWWVGPGSALFPIKRKSFCKHKTLILGNLWTFWYCVPSAYAPPSRSDTTSSCLCSSCLPEKSEHVRRCRPRPCCCVVLVFGVT